ncbi:MAG: hypothetical protein HQM10_00095 [Candidatus Riflebacteria bacterium]|nr:hypothetical protein [Candidatus Riflebacteria bacterium]
MKRISISIFLFLSFTVSLYSTTLNGKDAQFYLDTYNQSALKSQLGESLFNAIAGEDGIVDANELNQFFTLLDKYATEEGAYVAPSQANASNSDGIMSMPKFTKALQLAKANVAKVTGMIQHASRANPPSPPVITMTPERQTIIDFEKANPDLIGVLNEGDVLSIASTTADGTTVTMTLLEYADAKQAYESDIASGVRNAGVSFDIYVKTVANRNISETLCELPILVNTQNKNGTFSDKLADPETGVPIATDTATLEHYRPLLGMITYTSYSGSSFPVASFLGNYNSICENALIHTIDCLNRLGLDSGVAKKMDENKFRYFAGEYTFYFTSFSSAMDLYYGIR